MEFILSLIDKKPFAPDWRWVIWVPLVLTISDAVRGRAFVPHH